MLSGMMDEYLWSESSGDGFLMPVPEREENLASGVVKDEEGEFGVAENYYSPPVPSSRAMGFKTGCVVDSSDPTAMSGKLIGDVDDSGRGRGQSRVLLDISDDHPLHAASDELGFTGKPLLPVQRLLNKESGRSNRKRGRSRDSVSDGYEDSGPDSPYSSDAMYSEDSDYGQMTKRSRSNSPVNVQSYIRRPANSAVDNVRRKAQAPRRRSEDLQEYERWHCPYGCGKFYRTTSTKSVHAHRRTCQLRPDFKKLMLVRQGLKAQLQRTSSSSVDMSNERVRALREQLSDVERQLESDPDQVFVDTSEVNQVRRKQRRRRGRGELSEREKWYCPMEGCDLFYKNTSTRSIYNHLKKCSESKGLFFTPEEFKAKQKEGREHGRMDPISDGQSDSSSPSPENRSSQSFSAVAQPPKFQNTASVLPRHLQQQLKQRQEQMLVLSQDLVENRNTAHPQRSQYPSFSSSSSSSSSAAAAAAPTSHIDVTTRFEDLRLGNQQMPQPNGPSHAPMFNSLNSRRGDTCLNCSAPLFGPFCSACGTAG